MEEVNRGRFADLGLSQQILEAIASVGWQRPTPIQLKTIPDALEGKDLVGIAQTGTGKTGAFLIPILEKVRSGAGSQALVLCPTRELARQVAGDSHALSYGSDVRTAEIVGGVRYGGQIQALRDGAEIVVATPGRLIDHLGRGNVDLSSVRTLVLDEADRMLDMGFRPQIEEIIRRTPVDRQTMLISATMPHGVHALALRVTRDPVWIEAAPSGTTAEGIVEHVYTVKPDLKPALLLHLLKDPRWKHVLVFTRTKAGADSLAARLQQDGVSADVLHSDLDMKQRSRALERFSRRRVPVLVATDVAQRGLDVEGISHVVNYDIPVDPEDYVHRVGRTARAGAVGTAVTFVTAQDLGYLKAIEHRLGRILDREHAPEFDYAGTPGSGAPRGRTHARGGIGSKREEELTPEELEELLSFE